MISFNNSCDNYALIPAPNLNIKNFTRKKIESPFLDDNIMDKIKTKIQNHLDAFDDFQSFKKIDGITIYASQWDHYVFSFEEFPNLIFKMTVSDEKRYFPNSSFCDLSMTERFKNIEKGMAICKAHNLGMLVIPKAELITISEKTFLIEEKLDLFSNPDKSYSKLLNLFQEKERIPYFLLKLNQQKRDEIIKQLAIFILYSGFSDVAFRNLPLTTDFKVGLIDIEEMISSYLGLAGERGCNRMGLFNLFGNSSQKIIESEIIKYMANNKLDFINNLPDKPDFKFKKYPKSKQKLDEISQHFFNKIITNKCWGSDVLFIDYCEGIFTDINTLNYDTEKKFDDFEIKDDYYNSTLIGIVVKKFTKIGMVKEVMSRHCGSGWLIKLTS